MWAQLTLVAAVLWVGWLPLETNPWSAVLLALALLLLLPGAWQRSAARSVSRVTLVGCLLAILLCASALAGSNRSLAAEEAALFGVAAAVFFVASRRRPAQPMVAFFALGLAALALWAGYQVAFGFDRSLRVAAELSGPESDYAVQRLASGRAFASLLLPGHLAALLATALALLLPRSSADWRHWRTVSGVALCVFGLGLTYSPIGLALAAFVCVALLLRRNPGSLISLLAAFAVAAVVAVRIRPDLIRLEPVILRVDNWRTALWLWSTSPISGVGFGAYGEASQAVPFAVGNRPLHAHCLPLELVAELGVVGALLVALGAWGLWRLCRDLWSTNPGLAVAVAVLPLHNLLDFSFYTSAAVVPWALLAGWGWAELAGDPGPPVAPVRSRAPAMAVGAVVVVVATLNATSVVVDEAFAASSDAALAVAGSLRAHRLAPWRPEPVSSLVLAALRSSEPDQLVTAEEVLASSRWQRPASATTAALTMRLALARAALPTAAAAAAQAAAAQPHNIHAGAQLRRALAALEEARGRGRS